jgi:2-iminobutanoate/2-iminopropanoate deaminase
MNIVASELAPPALGPYSQAVVHSGIVYCSGQIGLNAVGEWVGNDVRTQARQCLENLGHVLAEANSGADSVLRATIFLASMDDFGVVNEEYAAFFGDHRPARACVEAARLPKDALVEISCIATVR